MPLVVLMALAFFKVSPVPALLYAPLAFACWLSPLIGIVYVQMGWFSKRVSPE
ncbi:hypothetical protein [Zobellella sp. DQSA1]|uniref:hypothetical protein n=1 Tax=Zobellella sp. DQSA1 TaxID=3342386 RepID=UPI0035C01DEA